jgi:hypothetical protein
MNKSNIEKTAKATEQDAGTPSPDLQKPLKEAKAKGGTVRSSLFGD